MQLSSWALHLHYLNSLWLFKIPHSLLLSPSPVLALQQKTAAKVTLSLLQHT